MKILERTTVQRQHAKDRNLPDGPSQGQQE